MTFRQHECHEEVVALFLVRAYKTLKGTVTAACMYVVVGSISLSLMSFTLSHFP